ncbi:MAG TPA: PaaI family thioesterase [Firmicutes bacterium]|uniref:PaaI family thioesterase n=1 Tax=candidate division TA06 bacterium TaxID=2250710 RepID=A0A660S4A4_UNCT6|nr:MAG: PaaI family thioesterase [candidate division TA06 bacterium]HFD05251.1 PaaI family thioesterase [Bacillota bacterium]
MRVYFPTYKYCYVCGRLNERGLKAKPYFENGDVNIDFDVRKEYVGADVNLHGGIIATLLDEVGYWATFIKTWKNCVTGEISVRYKKTAIVGDKIKASARTLKSNGLLTYVEGEVVNQNNEIIARMKGKYITAEGNFKDYFKDDEELQNYDLELFKKKIEESD